MLELILHDLVHLGNSAAITALFQVLVIDVALAGENAIVVGTLASALPRSQRGRVIAFGVLAALVLRVIFALLATQLMQVVGLVLAGGLLLLWVAWKMWREISSPGRARTSESSAEHAKQPPRSLAAAAWSVALADVSMSLDNVLGVAGAAKNHPGILILGLFLSVVLMGFAASVIARYIERYQWIKWLGVAVVLWVACTMIWNGLIDHDIGILRFL
jgi:YjbE family integral membrane protein